MGSCFSIIAIVAGGVFVMLTMIRWFEQTADAVDHREWNKLTLLTLFPFGAWLFSSRVPASRPTMVPLHEPVRGFGGLPKGGITAPAATRKSEKLPPIAPRASDALASPPPGTPKEFLGMPNIPAKKVRPPIDPDKLAKLREKMKQQGMLEDEN